MTTISNPPRQGVSATPSLKITDLPVESEPTATGTPAPSGKAPQLQDLDQLFGPLRIGEFSISRQEIQALGGRLNGQAIAAANTYFSEPDQTFIDALHFDPIQVEQRINSADGHVSQLVQQLLYEIATQRSPEAAPLMRGMPAGSEDAGMGKIIGLLNATQRLDIHKSPLSEHLPGWVDKAKSHGMTSMGVGLQAYGLYSAYIGTIDALKKGQAGEVLINVGGGLAEITSLGFEYALTRTGEKMIRQGALAFEQFGRTSMGKWLCRGAGLIASVLTLPFDIYTAIKSFNDAAKAEGKQAQDLYVTGGLSVFSAALSLALGCAALVGFQAAGPVGIAAAAIMIVGARVYGAARMVDDIDDYIELSVNERWRAGWFAFTGQDQDRTVMDRFTIAKTYSDYAKALQSKSNGWLDKELKDSIEAVVNGRFEVKLHPTRIYKHHWDEAKGELPYKIVDAPVITQTDDVYDARAGLPSGAEGIVVRPAHPSKAILWKLGDGNDTVQGVTDKPNFYLYGAGKKSLSGGGKDDSFIFESASAALSTAPKHTSHLQGGPGTDLLWLQGKHTPEAPGLATPPYVGYDIDLKNGKLGLRHGDSSAEPLLHSTFDSIERVETLAGAVNRVTGSDHADIISAHGEDQVNAGPGDDQISVRGSHAFVDGGSGIDLYYIDPLSLHVSITDDGQEQSKVDLGVSLEAIQRWLIRDNSLVIETLRGDDPYLPQRELVIEAVYQTVNGKRSLRNDKWMFTTQDGYHLQPDWLAETADLSEQVLSAVIITAGVSKTSPVLLHERPQIVTASPHSFYYVSRDSLQSILKVPDRAEEHRSTLYVDFDSAEIDEVRVIYTVESIRQGTYTVLSYKNVHFTLTLRGHGGLSLHGAVSEQPGKKTDAGAGILASPWQKKHHFTLIMRDGVSYHLGLPQNSPREDADNPGYRVIQSKGSLQERAGKYIFVKPAVEKSRLKNTPQRIDFKSAAHNAIYSLEGRSAHYELYPVSDMAIRLSTAAPDASTTGSSTWSIYTHSVDVDVTRQQLSIANNLLKVGSLYVYLPDSSDPLLALETVDIILTSGHRYRINALFEIIGLHTINALTCASPEAIVTLVQEHKQRNELDGTDVHIRHLHLRDDSAAKIFYDTETDRWGTASDRSRQINADQLIIREIPRS